MELNYKLANQIQLKFMAGLRKKELDAFQKIKFGKLLIANYQKAKKIASSKVEISGDWDQILEASKKGLESLLNDLKDECYITEEMSTDIVISYIDLLSKIQFLDFQEVTIYKEAEDPDPIATIDDEIDIDLYTNILE